MEVTRSKWLSCRYMAWMSQPNPFSLRAAAVAFLSVTGPVNRDDPQRSTAHTVGDDEVQNAEN